MLLLAVEVIKRGTHKVSVCVHHEKINLKLDAMDLEKMTKDTQLPLKSFKDCIKCIMCNNPNPDCHLNQCSLCPNVSVIKHHLNTLFHTYLIDSVEFQVWKETDRCTLKTEVAKREDFIDQLCDGLTSFKICPYL
ncbi:uncharacterized protein LOC122509360 [Leptopilina heterotoma]|uniref:uncharacterized protein LOC122509360 n=1 Tax=Leptopilina heterotoma TaxID=63436 RepID=UPI001CAA136D|nr:uncharacterized protein LOC122509360 [Leptopilina heterotoma]